MSICVYLCRSVSICVYISICVYLCLSTSICVDLCLYVSICVYMCLYMSICVYLCPSISIYIYTSISIYLFVYLYNLINLSMYTMFAHVSSRDAGNQLICHTQSDALRRRTVAQRLSSQLHAQSLGFPAPLLAGIHMYLRMYT